MKKIVLLLLVIISLNAQSQVAINSDGSVPDNSAMLDVKSTSKGVLVPRMTISQRNAISNPAIGLMIFQSDGIPGFYFNSGSSAAPVWEMVGASAGWGLKGNAGVSASNFIGTIDNVALSFKVNNQKSGIIDHALFNTAFGYQSLSSNTTGNQNVAIGYQSIYSSTIGVDNTASGYQSLYANTSGVRNSAFGSKALFQNTSGSYNTGVGVWALMNNTEGTDNTATGFSALSSNTIGTNNVAVGAYALQSNLTGSYNVALGNHSLWLNEGGSNNVSIGRASLNSNDIGNDNTAGGYNAMSTNTGGNYNSAWGREALSLSNTDYNTGLGYHAAYITTSGFQNTAVGANSLVNNTTGSYNTAIGFNTGPNAASLANTTTLGIDARATATDQVRLGNVFVNSIGGYVNWSNISDGRFKEDLTENVPGLSFITRLRPVTYRLNRDAINAYLGIDAAYKGEVMSGITSGFVAQEVEKTAQQLGYDFSGVDAPRNEKDVYALRYADFVVPLVKAVQEQQIIIDNQNKKIEELVKRIESLETAGFR